MSTSNLEIQITNLNEELGNLMKSHLNLLLSNFENYFPKQQAQELESKLWILNPFESQQPPDEIGLELKSDLVQKAFFNPGKHTEFWIKQLDGNYRDLAIQALDIRVQNPTTYLAEKGFSTLVDIKTKKRNKLLSGTLDQLMPGALEKAVMPNWSELVNNIQQQISH